MMETMPASKPGLKSTLVKDYTDVYKETMEEAMSMVENKRVQQAVDKFLALEKTARLNGDFTNVQNCCVAILVIYSKEMDFDNLNKYIPLLCKRRSQPESVQSAIVRAGADKLLPAIPKANKKENERLITTLREVSAGKLMLEVDRANLTMKLAKMKEEEGDIATAAKIIQEETPETYTSMERKSKFGFIIEQVRMSLAAKDMLRTKILLNKLELKTLQPYQDLAERFLTLQIDYFMETKDNLSVAKAHLNLIKCESFSSNSDACIEVLNKAILHLACSPYSSEQKSLILGTLENQTNSDNVYHEFIRRFITDEIIQWPMPEYEYVSKNPLIAEKAKAVANLKDKKMDMKAIERLEATGGWIMKNLFDQVIRHDIRVIATYYTTIYLDSLAGMLNMDVASTEHYLSEMIQDGSLETKIDRPEGIVTFALEKHPHDIITDWTSDISSLVELVDKTCHLIEKESMLKASEA